MDRLDVELDDWQLISTACSLLLWLHLLVSDEPWALLPAGLLFLRLAERINLIHPSLLPPPPSPRKRPSSTTASSQTTILPDGSTEAQSVHAVRCALRDRSLVLPPRYDDEELVRFLAATKGSVKRAVEMVAADVRWRARPLKTPPRGRRRVRVCGLDRSGRPCLLVRLDARVASEPQPFIDELLARLEEYCAGVWCVGGPQSLAIVVDAHRIGFRGGRKGLPLPAALRLLGLLRDHYPQRAGAIHILHLPPWLRWSVGAACNALDSATARKVVVHSSLASLHRHIEPAQLPVVYGGLLPDADADSEGDGDGDGEAAAVEAAPSPSRTADGGPRRLWSKMSAFERGLVDDLRGRATKAEVALEPPERWPDDELLRFLSDTAPPHDVPQALEALRTAVDARGRVDLPVPDATRAAWRHVLRLDGINRHGERALLVVINRELQDALLDPSRADGYILALVGALEDVRLEVFNGATDGIETIQTVIQVRRARRRSSHARTFD